MIQWHMLHVPHVCTNDIHYTVVHNTMTYVVHDIRMNDVCLWDMCRYDVCDTLAADRLTNVEPVMVWQSSAGTRVGQKEYQNIHLYEHAPYRRHQKRSPIFKIEVAFDLEMLIIFRLQKFPQLFEKDTESTSAPQHQIDMKSRCMLAPCHQKHHFSTKIPLNTTIHGIKSTLFPLKRRWTCFRWQLLTSKSH